MNAGNKERHTWREGYTTGSCAAGAAKAACALIKGESEGLTVEIPLPSGRLVLPVHRRELNYPLARAGIIKDGGDDPDVTHGLEVIASVRLLSPEGEICLKGGPGVGRVTKKGLSVPIGESAINPVPRRMILAAVREIFAKEEVEVTLEIPGGEEIAKRTLNPRLGIVGGLSILGTTGIVRPMSEEAFKESILPELDQAVAYGHQRIVLTPGHYGFRVATEHLMVPSEAVVQMSNFVGFLLEEAAYRGIREVMLLGHIGKLIKVVGGIFHTHNKVADARMEILVAHAALQGFSLLQLEELADYPTIEGAANELIHWGQNAFLNHLAYRASQRAEQYVARQQGCDEMRIGTVLTLLNGQFIGWDGKAREISARAGWSWPESVD
ncbi:MAG: cobalt-precorrin-5B (C(1))-methyltransferase CbiD [Desulfitobacteriaceae bacterium]